MKCRRKHSTHIVIPFYSCLELCQTEMDLDTEDDGPVRLAIPPRLWFRAATEWRQVRADNAKSRVLL